MRCPFIYVNFAVILTDCDHCIVNIPKTYYKVRQDKRQGLQSATRNQTRRSSESKLLQSMTATCVKLPSMPTKRGYFEQLLRGTRQLSNITLYRISPLILLMMTYQIGQMESEFLPWFILDSPEEGQERQRAGTVDL
jgi:hypothetical protein